MTETPENTSRPQSDGPVANRESGTPQAESASDPVASNTERSLDYWRAHPGEACDEGICLDDGKTCGRLNKHVGRSHRLETETEKQAIERYRDYWKISADVSLVSRAERQKMAETHKRLPEETKAKILAAGARNRPVAWEHSREARKGKKFSPEHKRRLSASKRGQEHPQTKFALWKIAEHALRGLPTMDAASLGALQPMLHSERKKMGFPAGWPGVYRHGEVLTARQLQDFCEDTDLTQEAAAEFLGVDFKWFLGRRWEKNRDRPLSSRHPKLAAAGDARFPHLGDVLAKKYDEVIKRFCYDKHSRWPVRNFLQSEIRDLPKKHATLTAAFSALGAALKSKEVSPETDVVLSWVCKKAREEVRAKSPHMTFRTLLFFGLPFKSLLNEKPELIRGDGRNPPGSSESGFRPGNLANELLAKDHGATPGRIEAAVHGELKPRDPGGLRLAMQEWVRAETEIKALNAELAKRPAVPEPKPAGRPKGSKTPEQETESFTIGKRVEEARPRQQELIATRQGLPRAIRKNRERLKAALLKLDFSKDEIEAGRNAKTDIIAARRFVENASHLSYDTVAEYHRAYLDARSG